MNGANIGKIIVKGKREKDQVCHLHQTWTGAETGLWSRLVFCMCFCET